jgi:endonuclease/exonuclease/phosphatase family metal-dependent hydrolase
MSNVLKLIWGMFIMNQLSGCAETADVNSSPIRVATFNVSMDATNYVKQGHTPVGGALSQNLVVGDHPQIKNIAEIIQRNNPDIILLNEFDYSEQSAQDIQLFLANYLQVSQSGANAIRYPYFYAAPVNTGVDSGLDLDKDGVASGTKGDAFGFGFFPGHYGMLVLSKYPIQQEQVRTFQNFLWKDMPDNLLTTIKEQSGQDYYSQQAQQILRLSSKSHWDIPIKIGNQTLHVLASHPTPPVFDGPENRNGKRNHDEIRFWIDYISRDVLADSQSSYIYDDKGNRGGFVGQHFVIAGDLNASPDEGDGIKSGIKGLLNHALVNNTYIPTSEGAKSNKVASDYATQHTASWGMRADYVLPSTTLEITNGGVFWPLVDAPLYRLVEDRQSSSDHRLVWVDIILENRK